MTELPGETRPSAELRPSVEISNLTVGYRRVPVLQGASLQVPCRKIAAVLGPSGSGKTTLLRAVAGFVQPMTGTIRLGGALVASDTTNVAPEHRNVGFVPQEGALFPHLDVAGNVGFGLPRRTKSQRIAADERVAELLDLVSMPNTQRLALHELSGGMQQRIALARALARRPQTVLLDEPFSALDAQLRSELRMQVRELLIGAGAGVILVTHDEDEAQEMADDIHVVTGTAPAHLAHRAQP